jgi:hypothetical protein
MTSLKTCLLLLAFALCSSFSVADEPRQGVSVSNTTTSGHTSPATPTAPPIPGGPTLPPVGQNCHFEKVCSAVSCTAYDEQGKCTKQVCVAWEERFVCK